MSRAAQARTGSVRTRSPRQSGTAPITANTDWQRAYANKSALKRWARADEMIGPTRFLASDEASYVTGTVLFADGGWTAILKSFAATAEAV